MQPIIKPTVIFLGFCERANSVTQGNTYLQKTNILGLVQIVPSYIFPYRLDEWVMVLAISKSQLGNKFDLQITNDLHRKTLLGIYGLSRLSRAKGFQCRTPVGSSASVSTPTIVGNRSTGDCAWIRLSGLKAWNRRILASRNWWRTWPSIKRFCRRSPLNLFTHYLTTALTVHLLLPTIWRALDNIVVG